MGVLRSSPDKNGGRRFGGTVEEAKRGLQGNHDDTEPVANPADDGWLHGKAAVASLTLDVDDRKTQSKLSPQRKDEEEQMTNKGGSLR